jgi:uncharacterized GH25 family protein
MHWQRSAGERNRWTARAVASVAIGFALVIVTVSIAAAHDMFVKPATHFAAENANVLVRVLNGTFSTSSNSIARNRIQDISVVSPASRFRVDTSQWDASGDTSTFNVRTGAAGTYVLGFSMKPNIIAMSGDTFNLYLSEDGIPDALAERRAKAELGRRVRERYEKHVKALLQVGASRTESYSTALGYPAEIIPLSNPYSLTSGDTLRVRILVDGKPAANQYILYGGRTTSEARIEQRNLRSNAEGVAAIPIRSRGTWYVKFIHMNRLSGDPDADYHSKWATLTFGVR